MRVTGDVIGYTAAYCGEIVRSRNEIVDTVATFPVSEQSAQYLISYPRSSTAGTTLLSRQIFDIAYAGREREADPAQRERAGRIGGLMLTLTDIVDGQIDRPKMPYAVKEHYLDEGVHVLLFGAESDYVPENEHQHVSFDLARALYEGVIQTDEKGLFASLFRDLIPDIKRQLVTDDLEEHLKLAKRIGRMCASLGGVSLEYVTGLAHNQAQDAAASIGTYAQCLDHAYEQRVDIREGVPTYVTLYLAQHGDTWANRRKARSDLLDVASDTYHEGLAMLDDKQIPIFKATCRMLDTRYRLIKRISSLTRHKERSNA